MVDQKKIRNIAIIAHVDHGKTTLVDKLLQESGVLGQHAQPSKRLLDSNDIEKERGITILAKCTTFEWKEHLFNIVDTPGHADFGGEVERILSMVDGAILLVDAAEGPLPQTKFVLDKALKKGLAPLVLVNKVDRPDARVDEVVNEVFDLFLSLEATDEQADFPILYASAKEGWVTENVDERKITMVPLLQKLVETVPAPRGSKENPFQFLASIIESNPYLGRILTGRIINGVARENMPVHAIDQQGNVIEQGRLTKIMRTQGVKQFPMTEAGAGEIISIAGLSEATVGSTVSDLSIKEIVPSIPIDPPTLAMTFSVNDSPYAGQDGDKLTSRVIRDRLFREAEGNISISVQESDLGDAFEVAGRGELQLGVLIENMRREGFELSISRPRVLYQKDTSGAFLEPMEEVKVDVDEAYVGVVVETLGIRKGEMRDMAPIAGGKTRLTFECPSRGLIGYRSQFLTDTRGTGIMHRSFSGYGPFKGDIPGRINGVLISNDKGKAVAYAIWNLEERGAFFVSPGDDVYQGMIIGEHNRGNDLEVNPLKAKKLTNVRASGKDEGIRLTPPLKLTLEDALSYIQDDELVEVTPKKIRLRKRHLDPNERKRNEKKKDI